MQRFAVVRNAHSLESLSAYLPDNYEVIGTHLASPFGDFHYVIRGEDNAGWTMEDYIIPRLASGNMWVKEYPSHWEATEAAAASMN